MLVGKTLNSEQVVEQTWVEASLAQENGVEFKINIAPTDWDGFGEGFIWVEYNDFCDLRIFRSQTGGISLWFQYWNGGVSYNGYADADISLAGTHVIRVANVNLAGKAISKQSVYVDGTLIGEQVFPYALKGYHLRVHNKTSKSFVISSNMSYTEESPVQDICDCFGNAQIAAGTTLGHQERVGVSTDITSNKTIEFSLTVSQEDWDNWGGNFLWISIGYLDLRIFNLEAASPGSGDGLSFWFQYWINGEAINVFAQSEGTTFAGTHTIRISLVNGTALSPASKTMVYVDGNIVAIQYATSYVNGVNINIENQTTRALSVASEAYYAIALNVLGETQYTVVNKGEDFVLPSVSEQDYIIVGWKDGENILAVGETVSSVRNLEAIAVLASAEMGASVRITEEAAIRWKFSVSKESYQYLIDTFGAENVKFTLELETDRSDVKQTREVTTWSEIYEGKYTCVAVYKGIKSNHYGWSFIARLYVTITCNGKTYTVYILENDNLRTPSEVACRAYYDRQDEYGGDYINLTKDGDYSPYDSTQLGVLATYFTVVNVQNNVVSIPDVDGAHKYVVEDDNSNIQSVVLYAGEDLAYTSDVVGEHNVNIKIYDSNDELLKVAKATFNVKPIWAYSNISNGAYYLTAEIAENYGAVLTQNQAYYNGYYYYNVEDKKYYDDSSKATEMLSFETLQEYKDCGFNVISLDTSYMTDYTGTPNANPIISYQRFNEIMDMAWSIGLKVIISDNYLINTSAQNQDSNGNGLYNNTANGYTVTKQWIKDCYRDMLSKFVTHKAFYGVNLWDEPGNGVIGGSANNRIKAVCEASCLINEIMQEDYPGIYCYQVCSLFPIVGSDYDKYYEYVEYMAKNSAVDHLIADTYMYTIYSIFDEKHYRESFDDTYEVMSEISKDYGKDMAICLTAFDFNESRGTHALTQYDVLVNTYYALAHDVEGFPYFIYWDFVAYGQEQITGCCVNKDGEKTAVYGYVQKAISEAKIITNLLEGYDYYARESLRIGYTSNAGVKTTLYNGKDDSYAYCWVNMAKEGSSSVVTVTINAGETYYLGTVKHVASEDIQIEVEPGQMLIEFANKEV